MTTGSDTRTTPTAASSNYIVGPASRSFGRFLRMPEDVTPAQMDRLEDRLAEAVQLQNRLADRSKHVLRFTGSVRRTEGGLVVEHEAADPLAPESLFQLSPPALQDRPLFELISGVIDALRVCHEYPDKTTAVHGGLCPASILITPDGRVKVSDFGFAPIVADVLGADAYLNLAICPGVMACKRPATAHSIFRTAEWRVLSDEVTDCDDRIWPFIDPDKCGREMYTSFEPGSDVIAVGMILYLWAHGRHPYFTADPYAHRAMHMVECLGMKVPTTTIHKELGESREPAFQAWSTLVMQMIDRIPQNRPTAHTIASQLVGLASANTSLSKNVSDSVRPATITETTATSAGWKATQAAGTRRQRHTPASRRKSRGVVACLTALIMTAAVSSGRDQSLPFVNSRSPVTPSRLAGDADPTGPSEPIEKPHLARPSGPNRSASKASSSVPLVVASSSASAPSTTEWQKAWTHATTSIGAKTQSFFEETITPATTETMKQLHSGRQSFVSWLTNHGASIDLSYAPRWTESAKRVSHQMFKTRWRQAPVFRSVDRTIASQEMPNEDDKNTTAIFEIMVEHTIPAVREWVVSYPEIVPHDLAFERPSGGASEVIVEYEARTEYIVSGTSILHGFGRSTLPATGYASVGYETSSSMTIANGQGGTIMLVE